MNLTVSVSMFHKALHQVCMIHVISIIVCNQRDAVLGLEMKVLTLGPKSSQCSGEDKPFRVKRYRCSDRGENREARNLRRFQDSEVKCRTQGQSQSASASWRTWKMSWRWWGEELRSTLQAWEEPILRHWSEMILQTGWSQDPLWDPAVGQSTQEESGSSLEAGWSFATWFSAIRVTTTVQQRNTSRQLQ